MKIKLGPSAYYMAGLMSKTKEENNAIGIKTGMHELEHVEESRTAVLRTRIWYIY